MGPAGRLHDFHDDASTAGDVADDVGENGVHGAWHTSIPHWWLSQGLQAPCMKNVEKLPYPDPRDTKNLQVCRDTCPPLVGNIM